MSETTPEQPWTPPVHDIAADRADLPLYERLYRATEALARPHLQEQLKAITAESLGQDLTQGLQALRRFISEDPESPAGIEREALEALNPAALDALRSSLATHLQKSSKTLKHENAAAGRKVAEQMAAELARSLWSTLLDHAARFAGSNGWVAPERLLPTWPDARGPSPLQDQLRGDLKHFSLPLEVLVGLSHATLERLALNAGSAAHVQLPKGLAVDRRRLRSFLDAQKQQQLRARQSPRSATARSGDKPALTTQQLHGW